MTTGNAGGGFDPEHVMEKHWLGLTSIKERLELAQGKLFISSQLGRGTLIGATTPINIASKAAEPEKDFVTSFSDLAVRWFDSARGAAAG